jgi:hypothetical protein
MITKFQIKLAGKDTNVFCYDPIDEQDENISDIGPIHHIHILDRSGSMHKSINQLIDNVQQSFEIIDDDDYITIIWFSSHNEYKTLIKGAKKTDNIKKLLDGIRSVLGTTCFSDPLRETAAVINDLQVICSNFSVTLFTDGNPVVPWPVEEEITKCQDLVRSICFKAIAFNTIGYGNYYNQDFLKSLSNLSESGVFVHANNINQYFKIFQENLEVVGRMENRRCSIESKDSLILYVGPKTISGSVGFLKQRQRSKFTNHYYIVNPKSATIQNAPIVVTQTGNPEQVEECMYALAYYSYYNGGRQTSLEMLSAIGDKELIDSHLKAFSFDECASHLETLKRHVFSSTVRYAQGKVDSSYVPAEDAFCVMDLIAWLAQNECLYVPFSDKTEKYKRIGQKTTSEFDLFERNSTVVVTANMSNIIYSSENLNMSIGFEVPGFVKLNPKIAKKVKLPDRIPSKIFRNHTLIKDGNLNMTKVEFLVPPEVVPCLERKVAFSVYDDKTIVDRTYKSIVIDLEQIPITNLAHAKRANLENIFDTMLEIQTMETRQKAVKHYLSVITEGKSTLLKDEMFKNYSIDQIKVLQEHGIDKQFRYNGVDKKKSDKTDCDFYLSKILVFSFKGIQKLPAVMEVLKRIEAKKPFTPPQEVVFNELMWLKEHATNSSIDLDKPLVATRNFLKKTLKEVQHKLFSLRSKINAMKIAVVLAGSWFDGVQKDDAGNQYYEKDGKVMLIKTGYEKKYFD